MNYDNFLHSALGREYRCENWFVEGGEVWEILVFLFGTAFDPLREEYLCFKIFGVQFFTCS
jgi:hypothetical protein